ncbi:MAG: HAD family hydrolase [Synechococcaceae cyanobacterium SM2_3_1]|nr:HAD family hydrolase [Synechococcaceae cyanobacterium SM2_3_1]
MGTQLIIFDFDGTLANSMPAIMTAIRLTVGDLGLPDSVVLEWGDMIGLPLRTQLSHLLPPDRQDEIEKAVSLYRSHYTQLEAQSIPPFAGVLDLIKLLGPDSPLPLPPAKSEKASSRSWSLGACRISFIPLFPPQKLPIPSPIRNRFIRFSTTTRWIRGIQSWLGIPPTILKWP